MTGVSDDLKEKCRLSMLHDIMNIFHIIVHAQQMEETRVKTKSRDANRENPFDGGYSKGRLDIQDKSRFKKRFANHVTSKFPKARDVGCLTLSLKRVEVLVHQPTSQLVESVARSTMVIALRGTHNCFGC